MWIWVGKWVGEKKTYTSFAIEIANMNTW
jgi:hypothetical protein